MDSTKLKELTNLQSTVSQLWLCLRMAPLLLPLAAITASATSFGLRMDRVPDVDNLVWIVVCLSALGILPIAILVGAGLLLCDVLYKQQRLLWLSLLIIASVAAVVLGLLVGPMMDF